MPPTPAAASTAGLNDAAGYGHCDHRKQNQRDQSAHSTFPFGLRVFAWHPSACHSADVRAWAAVRHNSRLIDRFYNRRDNVASRETKFIDNRWSPVQAKFHADDPACGQPIDGRPAELWAKVRRRQAVLPLPNEFLDGDPTKPNRSLWRVGAKPPDRMNAAKPTCQRAS
jgi:hypothetical protein